MTRLALLLAISSTCVPCLAQDSAAGGDQLAATWSQWRGPDRTGHCAGPAWPDRLNEENFRQLWRVPLEPSYSGPVVDRHHVFTTETQDEFEEVVTAFDRNTGEKRWQTSWEGAMSVPFFAKRNGSWIRSTPTLSDGALYVAGMRDVLVCLEAESGEVRWRVDLAKRFGTSLSSFGFVCSPLVDESSVYVQAAPGLVKLSAQTGETIWRSLDESGGMMGGAFSSPILAEVAGREQLVVQTRSHLKGVTAETGAELWSKAVRTFRGMNILTPLVHAGGIFTSAYGGRAHYYTLSEQDGELSVSEKWNARAQGYMTSPVVIGDHAYLYLRSKRFCCVNLNEGTVAWISESIGDGYWSLVAQGERILALTDRGELYLIAANTEEFEVVDRLHVTDSETWAHLAVDDGQVFVRELDALSAYRWQ